MGHSPSARRARLLLLSLSLGAAAIAGGCSSPTRADVVSTDATDASARETSSNDAPLTNDVLANEAGPLDVVAIDATDAPAPDDAPSTMDAAADAPADSRADASSFDAGDPLVPIAEFSGFGEISGLQASRLSALNRDAPRLSDRSPWRSNRPSRRGRSRR